MAFGKKNSKGKKPSKLAEKTQNSRKKLNISAFFKTFQGILSNLTSRMLGYQILNVHRTKEKK